MPAKPPSRRGFTIVELLVVIAIISILMSLLAVGIQSAIRTSRKSKELSNIRQLYLGWIGYNKQYDGALLPGYLDEATQTNWRVNYKNKNGDALPAALAQTYPWRLAEYLDHSYDLFLGYGDYETQDIDNDTARDWNPQPDSLPSWMQSIWNTPGSALALQPSFGYNAYYMGGWYTTTAGVSFPAYGDSTWTPPSGTGTAKGRLVAQNESNIDNPSEMYVFCSSTYRPTGAYKAQVVDEDHAPGAAWVVPPYLATTQIWGPADAVAMGFDGSGGTSSGSTGGGTDTGQLGVFVQQAVPMRRHTKQSAIVNADGSTGNAGITELLNMQHWMKAAWKPDFRHNP